jgi:beta-glucanase (GH16 family)
MASTPGSSMKHSVLVQLQCLPFGISRFSKQAFRKAVILTAIFGLFAMITSVGISAEASGADFQPLLKTAAKASGDWVFAPEHSDEFSGDKVDRDRWNVDTKDFGVWSWEPENVVQKDGSMHIQIVHDEHLRDGKTLYYKSGLARNERTITYGYFEARVKGCSRYPGASPAFWLYSIGPQNRHHAKNGEVVAYSEIDVIELQQCEFDFKTKTHFPVTRIDCNLHTTVMRDGKRVWMRPNTHPQICQNHFDADFDPRSDYHVYGVENTPQSITWYIDGVEVAKKPNLYWHLPMHVTLSLGLRHPFVKYVNNDRVPNDETSTADGFPTHMSVDYVRVWKRKTDVGKTSGPVSFSKEVYIAKEKTKWEANGWPWNQAKVEANFDEMDADNDGQATGKERRDWYSKKKAAK